MIRRPTQNDVPELARIHVQAWLESYAGLLPAAELTRRTVETRMQQWAHQITTDSTIAYAPGLGFAQSGRQRDATLKALGYPSEIYALYILDDAKGTGLGQALFDAVRPSDAFTALVIAQNARAMRFYERIGGQVLETRRESIGEAAIDEAVLGWGTSRD